jgi:hypothetical protein
LKEKIGKMREEGILRKKKRKWKNTGKRKLKSKKDIDSFALLSISSFSVSVTL